MQDIDFWYNHAIRLPGKLTKSEYCLSYKDGNLSFDYWYDKSGWNFVSGNKHLIGVKVNDADGEMFAFLEDFKE
jgi:hypothetical protein